MSKKSVKATTKAPQYYRAVDFMLAAVEYARKGMPNRAAKALADAAQDQQIDEALLQLNDQQQTLQDADFEQQAPQQSLDMQQQTSRALARLIKASQQQVAEGQDDEDDAGDDEGVDFDEDEVEDTDDAETADLAEDDLSIDLGQEDQEDEAGEMVVQASVQNRLARAARNKARRS